MNKFKINATKIQMEEVEQNPQQKNSGVKPYTLDHTIITYLINDENMYLSLIGSDMGSSDIAQHIVH